MPTGTALAYAATTALVEQPLDLTPHFKLQHGDAVVFGDEWWAFVGTDRYAITLQQVGMGRITRPFTHAEIHALYFDPANRMRIVRRAYGGLPPEIAADMDRPLTGYPKRDVDTALMRLDYVQATARLLNRDLISRTEAGYKRAALYVAKLRRRRKARELSAKRGRFVSVVEVPLERWCWSTLREWFWRWELSGGLLAALVPRHLNKGAREARLQPTVRRMIADTVRQKWLTLERLPLTTVHAALCSEIRKANAKLTGEQLLEPDIRSVWRWINKTFDEFDICWYREGAKVAFERYRRVKRGPVGAHQMHTVQIDYTQLDVFVVDTNGKPVSKKTDAEAARPWIVAAICTLTRMIVGYYITMDPPSWESVAACLRHMAQPKDL